MEDKSYIILQFMKIVKMHGAGNDFLLIDNFSGEFERFLDTLGLKESEIARSLCDRQRGIGADGLIIIEPSKGLGGDISWRFFNSDGSIAKMCGNGSRCAIYFAHLLGYCAKEATLETLAGLVYAKIVDKGRVQVELSSPKDFGKRELNIDGVSILGRFINTGVEHFVIFVDDIESVDVNKIGKRVRFHESFHPLGTNVNFVSLRDKEVYIRTYERGVESETLSCGTGACASAIALYLDGLIDSRSVKVITRGGDRLIISFDESLSKVFLEGPVCKVFTATLEEDFMCFSG